MTVTPPGPPAVAVVLTHRRPRLATDVVRGLIDVEGFPPERVVLVINGEGGLTDADLESAVHTVRLPQNLGPAGGYRAGLEAARALGPAWIYLCEDDVGLFGLPAPRVADVIRRVEALGGDDDPVGVVFAFSRRLNRRTGITVPHVVGADADLEDTDVSSWGASLVSAAVVDAGVLPDDDWFFGYEDFDFWLRVRAAGFRLVVDARAALAAERQSREEAFAGERPTDADEPWRAYYVARNFLELSRRHGHLGWSAWHLLKSARRWHIARSPAERRATVAGLRDGLRRRLGANPRYMRQRGEL